MRKKTAAATPVPDVPRIVGKVVLRPLASVQPNGWNPNRLTAFERESIKYGLVHDGWLVSQSMTVWGKDEKGKERNLIIDGEQRHGIAKELGLELGPMVFLDGITEVEAKALTVKLDAKRGQPDDEKMALVLKTLEGAMDEGTRALDLGIPERELVKYLAMEEASIEPEKPVQEVKPVQLKFSPKQYEEFHAMSLALAKKWGTKDLSTTVFEAVKRAAKAT